MSCHKPVIVGRAAFVHGSNGLPQRSRSRGRRTTSAAGEISNYDTAKQQGRRIQRPSETSASWPPAFAGAVRSRAILFGSSPTAAHSGLTLLRSTTLPSGDTALTRLEGRLRAPPYAGGSATRLRRISP